jgi:hypothetical protein
MSHALVIAGGIFNLIFVVFHLTFPRLFRWDEDLRSLTFLNRAIMPVLNLCLTFAFAIFGVVSLIHTDEMLGTALGRTLLVLLALFWLARAVEQVVFFKLRHWGSCVFLGIFLIGAALYGAAAFHGFVLETRP